MFAEQHAFLLTSSSTAERPRAIVRKTRQTTSACGAARESRSTGEPYDTVRLDGERLTESATARAGAARLHVLRDALGRSVALEVRRARFIAELISFLHVAHLGRTRSTTRAGTPRARCGGRTHDAHVGRPPYHGFCAGAVRRGAQHPRRRSCARTSVGVKPYAPLAQRRWSWALSSPRPQSDAGGRTLALGFRSQSRWRWRLSVVGSRARPAGERHAARRGRRAASRIVLVLSRGSSSVRTRYLLSARRAGSAGALPPDSLRTSRRTPLRSLPSARAPATSSSTEHCTSSRARSSSLPARGTGSGCSARSAGRWDYSRACVWTARVGIVRGAQRGPPPRHLPSLPRRCSWRRSFSWRQSTESLTGYSGTAVRGMIRVPRAARTYDEFFVACSR